MKPASNSFRFACNLVVVVAAQATMMFAVTTYSRRLFPHAPMSEAVAYSALTVLILDFLVMSVAAIAVSAAQAASRRARVSSIVTPPGSRLRGVLSFVYSRKTMEAVFEQVLGDVQTEWCAHECAGRRWHARMAALRGYVEIGQAVVAHGGATLFKLVARMWTLTH